MTALRNFLLAIVHGAVIFASTWATTHLANIDPALSAGGATTVWLGFVKYLSGKFPKLSWLVGVIAPPSGSVVGSVTAGPTSVAAATSPAAPDVPSGPTSVNAATSPVTDAPSA